MGVASNAATAMRRLQDLPMLFLAAWICASFPISVLIGYLISVDEQDT